MNINNINNNFQNFNNNSLGFRPPERAFNYNNNNFNNNINLKKQDYLQEDYIKGLIKEEFRELIIKYQSEMLGQIGLLDLKVNNLNNKINDMNNINLFLKQKLGKLKELSTKLGIKSAKVQDETNKIENRTIKYQMLLQRTGIDLM